MPFGDENFFYASGNPEMDAFVAQQMARQGAPKQTKSKSRPTPVMGGQPVGGNMFDNGFGMAMGGFNTAMGMSGMQGNLLQGIIDQTTSALSRENSSRVAQAREQNRMDHEARMGQMQIDSVMGRDREVQKLREIIRDLQQQLSAARVQASRSKGSEILNSMAQTRNAMAAMAPPPPRILWDE